MHWKQARTWKRARAVNSTATSFTAPAATVIEPYGTGFAGATAAERHVHRLSVTRGGAVPQKVQVMAFGIGDDDDVFDMRLIGWSRIHGDTSHNVLWIPRILASLTCTMSTFVGVAGSPLLATERVCDTLAILSEAVYTADTTNAGSVLFYSPTNNTPAWAEIDLMGSELLEFAFDTTTGDPTSVNSLFMLGC